MNTTLPGVLAILSYIAAAALTLHSMQHAYKATSSPERGRWQTLGLAWLAIILHGSLLIDMTRPLDGLDFSFVNALTLVSWAIAVLLVLTAFFKPVDKLGIVVYPVSALIILVKIVAPAGVHILQRQGWPMTLHILSSMLAYSLLNIAALQALLLALQDWGLRTHHANSLLVRSLPPLQTMENLLFQLLGSGFGLLTLSLGTGFIFLDNLFAQHLAHKTVLSILAWLVFAMVLAGRIRYGWRGQVAIRWTLGGFVSLMLAYFGSKMVMEWILKR